MCNLAERHENSVSEPNPKGMRPVPRLPSLCREDIYKQVKEKVTSTYTVGLPTMGSC
jgi:hypothetical protein